MVTRSRSHSFTADEPAKISQLFLSLCIKAGAIYAFTAATFIAGLQVLRRQGLVSAEAQKLLSQVPVTSERESRFALIAATSHTACLAIGYMSSTWLQPPGGGAATCWDWRLWLLVLWPGAFAMTFFVWLRGEFLSGEGWFHDTGRQFFHGQGSSSFSFVASFAYCGCVGLAWFFLKTNQLMERWNSSNADDL